MGSDERTAWERGAEGWWGKLVEMDRNNTPGSLNEELDHEAAGRKPAFGCWQNPCWNQESTHDSGADLQALAPFPEGVEECTHHRPPASNPLTEIS